MGALVYRVQDSEGRGPFRPGFSQRWSDLDFTPGMEQLPTIIEEFGRDIFQRLGRPGEHYGTAVRDVDGLKRWFSPTERERLEKLNFRIVFLRVNRVLAESKNQLLFARTRPLRTGVAFISWNAIKEASSTPNQREVENV